MSQDLFDPESDTLSPDFDPTTEMELPAVHDQKDVLSLIARYEQETGEDATLTELAAPAALTNAPYDGPSLDDFLGQDDQPIHYYRNPPEQKSNFDLLDDCHFERYAEVMAMVRSYEKMIEDDFDLGITLRNYPELQQIRLLSVSVYRSGSVILLGMDDRNMPINVFDKIDTLSFAISPVKRVNRKKPRGEVAFFYHDRAD